MGDSVNGGMIVVGGCGVGGGCGGVVIITVDTVLRV